MLAVRYAIASTNAEGRGKKREMDPAKRMITQMQFDALEEILEELHVELAAQEPRVKIMVRWTDLWVGAYIDTSKRYIYLCPLPMIVIRVRY